jgi:hypothetical protein
MLTSLFKDVKSGMESIESTLTARIHLIEREIEKRAETFSANLFSWHAVLMEVHMYVTQA